MFLKQAHLKMAGGKDLDVTRDLAWRADTAPEVLHKLSKHPDEITRRYVALHGGTWPKTKAALEKDKLASVRVAAKFRITLGESNDDDVLRAAHEKLTPEDLTTHHWADEVLKKHGFRINLEATLKHPSNHPDNQVDFWKKDHHVVQIWHDHWHHHDFHGEDVGRKNPEELDKYLTKYVSVNESTDHLHRAHEVIAGELAKDTGDIDHIIMAQKLARTTASPTALDTLAHASFGDTVRMGIAANPATNKKTLKDFVDQADLSVKFLATTNLARRGGTDVNESDDLLKAAKKKLVRDPDRVVKNNLLWQHDLPSIDLANLAGDKDPVIRNIAKDRMNTRKINDRRAKGLPIVEGDDLLKAAHEKLIGTAEAHFNLARNPTISHEQLKTIKDHPKTDSWTKVIADLKIKARWRNVDQKRQKSYQDVPNLIRSN